MNPKIVPWIYEKVQGMYTTLDDRPWPRFLFCDLLPLKKKIVISYQAKILSSYWQCFVNCRRASCAVLNDMEVIYLII